MKCLFIVIAFCAICLNALSDDTYRAFTDTKGRTIRAKVVSYNSQKNIVTIERDNHRRASIPLSMLSKSDRKYIKTWDLYKDFMNERRFRIAVKRKRSDNDDKSRSGANSSREVNNMGYEIKLENDSNTKFENIKIEYCIFYEQEVLHAGCKQGVYCGSLAVDKLPPSSKKEMLTKTVVVYKQELNSDWYYGSGAKNTQRGEVLGIWLRASMKTPDGETVVRNYCLPDTLPKNKQWTTSTVSVGMNH